MKSCVHILFAAALILALSYAASGFLAEPPAASNLAPEVSLGREVYISEGCIHCHSQYVRSDTRDVEFWGPYRPYEEILKDQPPLIGNRRQGPDLLNVGNRRSREWNRLHLINPQALSPGSVMPSYAHLFAHDDKRGPALLAYLSSLGESTLYSRLAYINNWHPQTANDSFNQEKGRQLYLENCAQCHGENGRGDGPAAALLSRQPRDLRQQAWFFIKPDDRGDPEIDQLMRVIKFGITGTSMPGHEWLKDADIEALARYVLSLKVEKTDL